MDESREYGSPNRANLPLECLGWLLPGGVTMLSTLELRHIIESAFLPLSCACTVDESGFLQITIFDPSTNTVELVTSGAHISLLSGNASITQLLSDLRGELNHAKGMREPTLVLGGGRSS